MTEMEMLLPIMIGLLLCLVIYLNSRIRELERLVERVDERVEHNYDRAKSDHYAAMRAHQKLLVALHLVEVNATPAYYAKKGGAEK